MLETCVFCVSTDTYPRTTQTDRRDFSSPAFHGCFYAKASPCEPLTPAYSPTAGSRNVMRSPSRKIAVFLGMQCQRGE